MTQSSYDVGSRQSSAIYALNDLRAWIERARVITTSDEEPRVAHPLRFRYREGNYGTIYMVGARLPSHAARTVTLENISEQISSNSRHRDTFIAAELFLKTFDTSTSTSSYAMGNIWQKVIGETVIPFDIETRQSDAQECIRGSLSSSFRIPLSLCGNVFSLGAIFTFSISAYLAPPKSVTESSGLVDLDDLEVNEIVLHEAIRRNVRLLQKALAIVRQLGIRMARFAQGGYDLADLSDEFIQFCKRESLRPRWDGVLRGSYAGMNCDPDTGHLGVRFLKPVL